MSLLHDVRLYGRGALLVTPGGGVRPAAYARAAAALDSVVEVVPGAETVLVVVSSRAPLDEVADQFGRLAIGVAGPEGVRDSAERPVVLDVVYDGEDLAAVADAAGLTVDDVVALHSGRTYMCEFCGFAPGFAYLSGLDRRLELPRRSTPRTSVPAGSVAIAGPYTAVYPSASPGGWHLLGRTAAVLWDVHAEPPATIEPGTRVQFRPVSRSGRPPRRNPEPAPPRTANDAKAARLRVVRPGISTSFQDRGRPGYAALGVPPSGALDAASAALTNRLVGNGGDQAVIETAGGLVLRADAPVVVAESTSGAVQTLAAGNEITVSPAPGELYAYLAVRGGWDVAPVLGSRSWDSLSRLGPAFPETESTLPVGPEPGSELAVDLAPHAAHDRVVRLLPGPRLDWFADEALTQLISTSWTMSADVSRVGSRLSGPPLARRADRAGRELPSEGLITGAVQVPHDGQPVVMLSDHPTTGGYPVIAVVDDRDLAIVAQAPPGSRLAFRRAEQSRTR